MFREIEKGTQEMTSTTVTLKNDVANVTFSLIRGLNILSFNVLTSDGKALPIMPVAESVGLAESSFVLVPYSNRIEDGEFMFNGKQHKLRSGLPPHNWPHAMHGDLYHRRPLNITHTDNTITWHYDSREVIDSNWDWDYTAEVTYKLDGRKLSATLTVTNKSDEKIPAGLGWHPYFSRHLTREGEPVILQFNVDGVYPDANGNRMPSGAAEPIPETLNITSLTPHSHENALDHCFTGYDGDGSIEWPESGVKAKFSCEGTTHLVLYNPDDPYFAVEPVTNANNGINLHGDGDETSGIVVLEPNNTLTAQFDLNVIVT